MVDCEQEREAQSSLQSVLMQVLEVLQQLGPLVEAPPQRPWEDFFGRGGQYRTMLRVLKRKQGEGGRGS